jgi:hypothetical protein
MLGYSDLSKHPLLSSGSLNITTMATLPYATLEELLEAAFSVRSMPRLYNEDHLPLQDGLELAISECSSCAVRA